MPPTPLLNGVCSGAPQRSVTPRFMECSPDIPGRWRTAPSPLAASRKLCTRPEQRRARRCRHKGPELKPIAATGDAPPALGLTNLRKSRLHRQLEQLETDTTPR